MAYIPETGEGQDHLLQGSQRHNRERVTLSVEQVRHSRGHLLHGLRSGYDQCTISNKDCSTLKKKAATEFEKYETNELFGAVLPVKGANTLDWNGMKRDCGDMPDWQVTHPKEPDY